MKSDDNYKFPIHLSKWCFFSTSTLTVSIFHYRIVECLKTLRITHYRTLVKDKLLNIYLKKHKGVGYLTFGGG